jgi:ribosomal protein S18 acetylase RimI-like enzyme
MLGVHPAGAPGAPSGAIHLDMNDHPNIERLTTSHIDGIVRLWDAAGLPYKPKGRDAAENLARRIESGADRFFGILEDGRLIAVILATHDGRKGWLNRLAVEPSHRRRGLAKLLLRHAEEHLRADGIGIIAVLIEGYNTSSLELVRSCGYVEFEGIHYLTKRSDPDV